MWGLVEDNVITKIINQPKGMVIGDTRHSRKIFSLWSEAELNNIGIYSVVFDNSNKKDEAYYNNTNQSFDFADGAVTASYGSATANALVGLKSQRKETVKQQSSSLLTTYDWYVIRKADAGTAVPSAVTTYRAAVRTKSGEMETLINNAANVDALAALYVYNNDNPPVRPLGEFPEAV